jgi:ribonucleoside-diphosphate reductase alpha chain
MCKVAWDRGPVRHGLKTREDGTRIPLWHDSEVAAIAFAIQNILVLRASRPEISTLPETLAGAGATASTVFASEAAQTVIKGKKCADCGAHAVIRKDGCDYCTQCGYLGSCG